MSDNPFNLNNLGNKAKGQLHVKKSPFSKKKVKRHPVWINDDYYKKIKLLTIIHEKTTIMFWVNKAIKHAFEDGTIPKPKI